MVRNGCFDFMFFFSINLRFEIEKTSNSNVKEEEEILRIFENLLFALFEIRNKKNFEFEHKGGRRKSFNSNKI